MAQRISYKVHGKVQGVFFRVFTVEKAQGYGLTGFVANTANGEVIGEAQGGADEIKSFLADINQGPKDAHVVKLEKSAMDVKEGEEGFEKRRGKVSLNVDGGS